MSTFNNSNDFHQASPTNVIEGIEFNPQLRNMYPPHHDKPSDCDVLPSSSHVKLERILVQYHTLDDTLVGLGTKINDIVVTLYGLEKGGKLLVLMENVDLVKLPSVCSFFQEKFGCHCESFANELGLENSALENEESATPYQEDCRIVAETLAEYLLDD